jgi:WD40 repeat protein
LRVFAGHRNFAMGVGFVDRPGEPNAASLIAAAGMDRTIRIWDSDSAVTQRLLQGHEAGILGIAIHGGYLYSAANDGTVRRWRLALPRQRLLDLPSEPRSAAIAPDGGSVAVGFADGALRIYGLPGLYLRAEVPDAHSDRRQLGAPAASRQLGSAASSRQGAKETYPPTDNPARRRALPNTQSSARATSPAFTGLFSMYRITAAKCWSSRM